MRSDEMAVDAALAFVATHPHVYLLGRMADGFPTGWAMTATVDGRSVLFSTYARSAKVTHLLREGRARVLATEDGAGPRLVEVSGPIRVLDADRWLGRTGTRGTAPSVAGTVPRSMVEKVRDRHASGKRIALELVVERARAGTALV